MDSSITKTLIDELNKAKELINKQSRLLEQCEDVVQEASKKYGSEYYADLLYSIENILKGGK